MGWPWVPSQHLSGCIIADRKLNFIKSPTFSPAQWEYDISNRLLAYEIVGTRDCWHRSAHFYEPSKSSRFSPYFFTVALTSRSFCHRHKLVNWDLEKMGGVLNESEHEKMQVNRGVASSPQPRRNQCKTEPWGNRSCQIGTWVTERSAGHLEHSLGNSHLWPSAILGSPRWLTDRPDFQNQILFPSACHQTSNFNGN